jgi:hypothetical protein
MGDAIGDWPFDTGQAVPYRLFGFVYFFASGRTNVVAVATPEDGPAERMEYPAEALVVTDSTLSLRFGPKPISFIATCVTRDTLSVRFSLPAPTDSIRGTAQMVRSGPIGARP